LLVFLCARLRGGLPSKPWWAYLVALIGRRAMIWAGMLALHMAYPWTPWRRAA
jgi:NADH:ubiquinone oxidoreductase subunit 5 (subunit L)/multisubunit Na+/H+ antiporter MnhA subunit